MNELAKLPQRPTTADTHHVVFVSRQPIHNRSARLFAYEVLYRRDVVEQALVAQSDRPDNKLILNMLLGLESLVCGNLAFMNVTRPFILRDYCRVLPKEKVVLEISPEVGSDESVLLSLTALRELGYKLALDDFNYTEHSDAVVKLASYASLNFASLSHENILGHFELLVRSKIKPIATNLETHEEFETASAMGFEYFRGFYFNKPKITVPMRVPINRLSTMQLVLKLQNPDLSAAELEKIVSQDLAISYELLRFVNSAALSLARHVESIKYAIQMVGTDRIRRWASLLLLKKVDNKPAELLVTALVRAKMCEGLAMAIGAPNPDSYYMVGLFSLVDGLLNITMSEAIQLLPFSKQVREALLDHDGQLGFVLSCVLDYENGNWDAVCGTNLNPATIRECYLEAIAAAQKMPRDTDRTA